MNRHSISIKDITIPERFRQDYGDIDLLKHSIQTYGLLQPIVLNQDRVLISGGRRLRACTELKLEFIDVVFYETLSEGQRLELEALENIIRKNFSWQEECLALLKIHRQRKREATLDSSREWNTRLAAELFGKSKGALDYILIVAQKLEQELKLPEDKRKYHQFQSVNEAYRLGYLDEQERLALAELAKKQAATTVPKKVIDELDALVTETKKVESSPDLLAEQRERFYANPLNKGSFEEYWNSRKQLVQQHEQTVYLSTRLFHTDSISFMLNPDNKARFDHILTDIPYGIDMEMLNQNNQHGGLTDLDRVKEEHDVEENMALMERFFPAAFHCTKEHSFLITYCDIMQWQYMYDLAVAAGWNVQRWPIIWHKNNAMNNCASYNSTKNYEILMVCRKPGTVLVSPLPSSILPASVETAKTECGHPFSKPYEITRILADAISIKGQSFLEPFAGRGSIAIQLLRQERSVIACEKQDDHYNALMEVFKRYFLSINPNTLFK